MDAIDAIQLPEEFLNPAAPKKKFLNSSFMITINSNKSSNTVSRETFARIGKKLIFAALKTKEAFDRGEYLKPMPSQNYAHWKPPKLKSYGYGLERGGKLNMAHIHIAVVFHGGTHIRQDTYRQFILNLLQPECSNAHVSIKGSNDISGVREQYIKKNYVSLADQSSL